MCACARVCGVHGGMLAAGAGGDAGVAGHAGRT